MSSLPRHLPVVALVALLVRGAGIPIPPAATTPDAATRARIAAQYGDLPLAFEVNQGQSDARVRFLARGPGYSLFLTPTQAVLAFRPAGHHADATPAPRRGGMADADVEQIETDVVSLALAGANQNPVVAGLDPQPGKSHYLLGNDPARWHRNVDHYAKVKYSQVYPGVDVVYYGNQRQLEYDFVIAPGIDPRQIRLGLSGVQGMQVDEHGNLVIKTGHGDLLQHKPIVYQDVDGVRQRIDGRYALLDKRHVGFDIGRYDTRLPLVIDPVLAYSTYLGGSALDEGHDIAVDGAGNAYVTGSTASTNFPTAPLQGSNAGGSDIFITKLSASGSALVYSTYLGGSADDVGLAIAVDGDGNACVTGYTRSIDFPTFAALQPTYGGGNNDAFVAKLQASGSTLFYSTYLGGTAVDIGSDIAVDGIGNAYVTGFTRSINFPTAMLPPQAFNSGGGDAFVSKFNAIGSALLYSTYLGGTAEEDGEGIAVDGAGNAYVTGITRSPNFPTNAPLQAAKSGGGDAYAAKLNPTGSGWIYSTYLGGGGEDRAIGIAVDAAGSAYITGYTSSIDFPTAAALQPSYAGGTDDAFASKLNAAGSALAYSTYLGGSGTDQASAIAVDNAGNAVITGQTNSTDFPMVAPLQATGDQTYGNAFVTQLNGAGSALGYSTYFGGSGPDNGAGIAVDAAGNAYVAGTTQSFNFPVAHAGQATNAGLSDAFVVKIGTAVFVPPRRNDFNGDGKDDILWRNHSTGANVIWKSAVSSTPQGMSRVGNLAWGIVGTGDFNGDRNSDVLWRNAITGANAIWKSANSATQLAVTGVSNLDWQVAGVGDFNGDGKDDILWRNNITGASMIWKSASAATRQGVTRVTDLAWRIAGVGDFNGDGKSDVLWRNAITGANAIWKSANSATQQAVTGVTNLAWQVADIGDFNGDGKSDILWRNRSTGANVIWKSGRAATPQAVTGVTNLDWHVVGAGDYNGDKTADVLWRNLRTGANVIWKSAGSANQQPVTGVTNLAWVVEP